MNVLSFLLVVPEESSGMVMTYHTILFLDSEKRERERGEEKAYCSLRRVVR